MAAPRTRYRDIVAIGASAGGAQTLTALVGDLPAELPASVLVAQHTAPAAPAMLPDILARAGPMPATLAADGDAIERGHIYVAPPDHHLLVGDDRLLVTGGRGRTGIVQRSIRCFAVPPAATGSE